MVEVEDVPRCDVVLLATWHRTGGAQLCAAELSNSFEARGLKASLGFLFEFDPLAEFEVRDRFIVGGTVPRTPDQWLRFLMRARKKIHARKPAVVMAVQPLSNIVGSLCSVPYRYRFIGSQHNPAFTQTPSVATIEKLLGSTPLYKANIAVSHFVKDSFERYPSLYKDKLRVIYNTPPALSPIDEDMAASRKALGIKHQGTILGTLSRFHEQKNLSFALRVIHMLPDAHLYLAGWGPQESMLRELAASLRCDDRVHFVGKLSGQQVAQFYNAIDMMLFPSIYEGHSRVMLEAMTHGVPIIANDIAVLKEAGGDAVAYAELDAARWSAIIRSLNSQKLMEMRERGRERAEYFASLPMVERYMEILGLR